MNPQIIDTPIFFRLVQRCEIKMFLSAWYLHQAQVLVVGGEDEAGLCSKMSELPYMASWALTAYLAETELFQSSG